MLAIARTEEFVKEAKNLATDFPNILEGEVYSGSTIRLLYKILPKGYTEEINDFITADRTDVYVSDKQSLTAIKHFLAEKRKSAILGANSEFDRATRYHTNDYQGDGRRVNYATPKVAELQPCYARNNARLRTVQEDNRQACKAECWKVWDLLGCVKLYKLKSAK